MELVTYIHRQTMANHGEVITNHNEIKIKYLEIMARLLTINHQDLKYDPFCLNDENYLKNDDEAEEEGEKVGKSLFEFIKQK